MEIKTNITNSLLVFGPNKEDCSFDAKQKLNIVNIIGWMHLPSEYLVFQWSYLGPPDSPNHVHMAA
ncbi:hypothetical protein K6U49_05240, partial [Vibrio alginolyticus]|uniref:hypothetical protein n=1 Tax=Vibrio alginolyticus TaxID=663 RepID=UPI001EEBAD64